MELESLNCDLAKIFDTWPKSPYNLYSTGQVSPDGSFDAEDAESYAFLHSILKDDKSEFVSHAKRFFVGKDLESERSEALELISGCCGYDCINCASPLINGDVRSVPYINDVADDTGLSPLHTAAEAHAPRCVEMLLKRRARTDVSSKDERSLLPLELSHCNGSLDVTWNPSSDSIGDLILLLGDKDLTVVKLVAAKTKEVDKVANAYAKAGAIVSLTALLIVAIDKIREATVSLQDDDSVSMPKITIYESVIQEALHSNNSMQSECNQDGSSVLHKQQTRIMNLLIANGARVTQRNKLGLSAVHFAPANGNVSALEILLAANPELVHVKTVIKEMPLFFAVKNNHLDCVELLLQCGASTEIHNLRKQRPIELTQSQDIRFVLNTPNISCVSKETEHVPLHQSAIPTKADDEETSFLGNSVLPWLKKFINWLPRYVRDTSESWRETGYPLSSLKADFRTVFGMDLDHASLGYAKLSDFIKYFPKLCQLKVAPVGKSGSATHWVLLPSKCSQLKGRHPEPLIINNRPKAPSTLKADPEPQPHIWSGSFIQQAHVPKTLKPELEPPLAVSYSNHHQLKHPVLETLARIRNSTSIFFLREFDFYQSYETCLREGMCFWCNKRMLLWANFPCRHKLWCSYCKQEVTQSSASGSGDHHRCVLCDAKVERFILSPPFGLDQHRFSSGLPNDAE